MPAGAPVIQLHQIRKVLALPAAVSPPSLAAAIDTVDEADFEDSLLRTFGNLLDSQRKGMAIEQQLPVAQQPAAGPHKPPFPVPTQTQEAPATMFQRHTLCESSDEMPHRWVVVDTLGGRRIGDAWAGAILASYPAWTSRVANQGWETASRAVMLLNIVADEEDLWVRLNT